MTTATVKGKRTARSASTRSTRPVSIKDLRRERKDNLTLIERQSFQITAQFRSIGELRQRLDRAEQYARDLRLDVARHEGYIDRVREMDGQTRVTRTRLSQAISKIADEDLSAEQILQMSDGDFAKLVDKASPALDRALGRDDFEDYVDD